MTFNMLNTFQLTDPRVNDHSPVLKLGICKKAIAPPVQQNDMGGSPQAVQGLWTWAELFCRNAERLLREAKKSLNKFKTGCCLHCCLTVWIYNMWISNNWLPTQYTKKKKKRDKRERYLKLEKHNPILQPFLHKASYSIKVEDSLLSMQFSCPDTCACDFWIEG